MWFHIVISPELQADNLIQCFKLPLVSEEETVKYMESETPKQNFTLTKEQPKSIQ